MEMKHQSEMEVLRQNHQEQLTALESEIEMHHSMKRAMEKLHQAQL